MIIKVEERAARYLEAEKGEVMLSKPTLLLIKMEWRSGGAAMFPFLLLHHSLGRQLRMKVVPRSMMTMGVTE